MLGSAPAYGSRGFHCCMMGMLNHPSKKEKKNSWGSIEPHLPTPARCKPRNEDLRTCKVQPAVATILHSSNWLVSLFVDQLWQKLILGSSLVLLCVMVTRWFSFIWCFNGLNILYSWPSLTNPNWMLSVINLIHPPPCSFSLMWKLGGNILIWPMVGDSVTSSSL